MLKRIVTLALLIGLPAIYVAQGFYSRNNWKNRKHEFALGGGVSNALTDLGGGAGVGRDLTPLDLDFPATSYAFTLEYSYAIARKWNIRVNAIYGQVEGDDRYTTSYRSIRGINFRSPIAELSTVFIHHFSKERIGHLYSLRNTRGTKLGVKPLHLGWYVFGGVGGFYYNPIGEARYYNPWGVKGEYNLRGLKTEGQSSQYSVASVCMPVGVGARHSINGSTGVKIEFGYRFTFTDYLDDTSTKFPVESEILANSGSAAAYFAQPTAYASIGGVADPSAYLDGVRGNSRNFKERDGYMFLMLTFYFNRDPRHWFDDARRSAIKVRRPKASF